MRSTLLLMTEYSVLIPESNAEVGGMIVQTEKDVGSPRPQAAGSHLMIKAQSLEEARTIIETDIYYTSGVVGALICYLPDGSDDKYTCFLFYFNLKWDRERIVILPFISATPFPQ